MHDAWGVAMLYADSLAAKPVIEPTDLADRPLIASLRLVASGYMAEWLGASFHRDNVVATVSLPSAGMHLVAADVGIMFTYFGLPVLDGLKVVLLSIQPAATVGLSGTREFLRTAAGRFSTSFASSAVWRAGIPTR